MIGMLMKAVSFGRPQPASAGLRPVPRLRGGVSPEGTVEFSRGRKPTVWKRPRSAQPRSGGRAFRAPPLSPLRGLFDLSFRYRGLTPTAKLFRRYAAGATKCVERPRTTGNRRRGGFTLVELLVVIFIMLAITAVTLPVIAPAMQNRDVREAARMIDVFINGARTRAKLNGHPYGVMIERTPGQPNAAVTLSYCEQPDAYSGDFQGSGIRMLGNGGFGTWVGPVTPMAGGYATQPNTAPSNDPLFKMGDMGWIQAKTSLAGTGPCLLTNIAPGDIVTVNGTQFRIWAGEPFVDLNQSGYWSPGEPFADVDGSGSWTPPNPPPGQTTTGPGGAPFPNVVGQPFVDPASGYFVQPNLSSTSPFPQIVWGTPSAFITYMYLDPVLAGQSMTSRGLDLASGTPIWIGPGPWNGLTAFPYSITRWAPSGIPPMPVPVLNAASIFSFSFSRRPIKTSAPSIQLPGNAVIDLGASYPDAQYGTIVPIPGSGMEVLVQNMNASGWWSTFRANPLLDPSLNGKITGVPSQPLPASDPTSIMITFFPDGTVERVYSWSEANNVNAAGTGVNWTDWQGRIPASPIYLLVGKQELIDGDPNLIDRIAQGVPPYDPATKSGGPIYNVQDPTSLWVVINPLTGAVTTSENVGFDLTQKIPTNASWTGTNAMEMQIYWAANVYYSRRLARAMLDMGGR